MKPIGLPSEVRVAPKIGVHFGLEEDVYHQDAGIGSTDIRKLARNPSDYWYESPMNPRRPPPENEDTPARLRGSAVHKIVLEGETAFDAAYARGPDQEGMSTVEKTASTKAAKAAALASGRRLIPAEHYDRAVIAAAMIGKNPALRGAFIGGMPEVSVVYEADGVRRKARFDYLKIRGIGDIKTCANTRGLWFPAACRNDIANYGYHEQVSWYLDARAKMLDLVADGAVYGDHDPAWLRKVVDSGSWAWQFVFYQTESAPITWSCVISPRNPLVEMGRIANRRGVDALKAYREQFGDDVWVLIEEPRELEIESMPGWFGR